MSVEKRKATADLRTELKVMETAEPRTQLLPVTVILDTEVLCLLVIGEGREVMVYLDSLDA